MAQPLPQLSQSSSPGQLLPIPGSSLSSEENIPAALVDSSLSLLHVDILRRSAALWLHRSTLSLIGMRGDPFLGGGDGFVTNVRGPPSTLTGESGMVFNSMAVSVEVDGTDKEANKRHSG